MRQPDEDALHRAHALLLLQRMGRLNNSLADVISLSFVTLMKWSVHSQGV